MRGGPGPGGAGPDRAWVGGEAREKWGLGSWGDVGGGAREKEGLGSREGRGRAREKWGMGSRGEERVGRGTGERGLRSQGDAREKVREEGDWRTGEGKRPEGEG